METGMVTMASEAPMTRTLKERGGIIYYDRDTIDIEWGVIKARQLALAKPTLDSEYAAFSTITMIAQCVRGRGDECWYIAGPMRGIPKWNFPAFDAARDFLVSDGHRVISPADLDRARGFDEDSTEFSRDDWHRAMAVDTVAISLFATGIYLLDGYDRSIGARAELEHARITGKKVRKEC